MPRPSNRRRKVTLTRIGPEPAPVVAEPTPEPAPPEDAVLAKDENGKGELSEQQQSRLRSFIRSLPTAAKDIDELNWVYCHPRMIERSESNSALSPIHITLADIKSSPNGPAPSQRAIQMLRHWSQNPRKFFEQQLDMHKKKSSAASEEEDREELEFLDDLSEVDRMIKEATKNTRVKSEPESA
jgi:hypothetical protein